MLLYNVEKEELKIGKRKGQVVYYAKALQQDKITTKQVEDRIVEATALSRADVRSAITALAEIVKQEMLAGRSVDLADLGTFKVVSNGKRMNNAQDVTSDTLKTPRIQFFPKHEMRDKAKNVGREIIRPSRPSAPHDGITAEQGSGQAGPRAGEGGSPNGSTNTDGSGHPNTGLGL